MLPAWRVLTIVKVPLTARPSLCIANAPTPGHPTSHKTVQPCHLPESGTDPTDGALQIDHASFQLSIGLAHHVNAALQVRKPRRHARIPLLPLRPRGGAAGMRFGWRGRVPGVLLTGFGVGHEKAQGVLAHWHKY